MVRLHIYVLVVHFVIRVERIEVRCGVVLVLVKEVPTSNDTRRHVVQASHTNVAVVHIVREITTEIRVAGVESDIARHGHVKTCNCREGRHCC